jgi:uncharacterized protein (DUF2147 family)
MKIIALQAAGFAVMAGMAWADPVEGVWQTRKDDNGNFGHVEIKPCGPAFCGTLVRAFNGEGKEIDEPERRRKIVWDMVAYPTGFTTTARSIRPTGTRPTTAT